MLNGFLVLFLFGFFVLMGATWVSQERWFMVWRYRRKRRAHREAILRASRENWSGDAFRLEPDRFGGHEGVDE